MNRQNVRKALIIISFLLFPITIYYLSPYLIIQGAVFGIVTGSFIVFSVMSVFSLFLGRAFCGWICPAGGLQECCTLANKGRAKGGRLNLIKFLIWVPWVSIIAVMFIRSGGIKKIDFIYMTDHGVSVTSPQAYIIFYVVVALIVILSLTAGRRAFCHYVCWMAPFMMLGRSLRNILKSPALRLRGDSSKCVGCKACTNRCPMSLEVMDMVKRGNMENSECILCGECIDGCSKKAIKYSI